MNKILQFPLTRIMIAVLFVGIGIAVGQAVLNVVRPLFAITNTGMANIPSPLIFKAKGTR